MRLIACALAVCVVCVGAAHAQGTPVDEAWARYRAADFRQAIDTLSSAEAAGQLPAGEYTRALEIRALAAHALGDRNAVTEALRLLAAIDPDYVLGPEAVPAVREELDALRRSRLGRVELSVRARAAGGQAEIAAEVGADPMSLVRRLAVFGRRGGETDWQEGDGSLRLAIGDAVAIEHYAEAYGPAGVRVASAGSAAQPRVLTVDTASRAGGGRSDDEGGSPLGWIVGVSAAVVLAAIVVVVLVAGDGQDEPVDVRGPTLPWDGS